jgi:hypothetical protein
MRKYRSNPPRLRLGLAAFAMMALTVGTLVVLPSRIEASSQTFAVFTAAHAPEQRPAPPAAVGPTCQAQG